MNWPLPENDTRQLVSQPKNKSIVMQVGVSKLFIWRMWDFGKQS